MNGMTSPNALTAYIDTLPANWKWDRSFEPPQELATEWQIWLANAQRAELDSTLRYWAAHSHKAKQ
jgi:hypothetical protein